MGPKLGALTQLTHLRLDEELAGTQRIPSEMANFAQLKHLYLYYNSLMGNIPSEIYVLIYAEVTLLVSVCQLFELCRLVGGKPLL